MGAGRAAVGATASVKLPDGRLLAAQVDGGNGFAGRRSADLHFGLGKAAPDQALPVDIGYRDPAGRVHHETLSLKPGWHTVVLAWANDGAGK